MEQPYGGFKLSVIMHFVIRFLHSPLLTRWKIIEILSHFIDKNYVKAAVSLTQCGKVVKSMITVFTEKSIFVQSNT